MIQDFMPTESTTVEYKVALETAKPKSWLKTVSAFSNTAGGTIVFGVADDRSLVGLEDITDTAEKLTELINTRIEPAPNYELRTIDDRFLVVIVRKGKMTPYYYTGDGRHTAYIRMGSSSVEAPVHMLNSLILNGQSNTFDSLPSAFSLDNVSFTLLEATYRHQTGGIFDRSKDLLSFGLVTADGRVTYAGLLFSDQAPLRQSRIFCVQWCGTTKGTIRGDALDSKEYEGSIITLLQNAEDFIRGHSLDPWSIGERLQREERPEYRYSAIREALVNAIIHRDYQIVGSEVHIDMYSDRLEIYSPGGMCGGGQIQTMDLRRIPSVRRNPVIADLLERLGYMEHTASGIGRILELYKYDSVKPSFLSDSAAFFVTFPKLIFSDIRRPNLPRAASGSQADMTDNEPHLTDNLQKITDKKSAILMYIKRRGTCVANKDITAFLGVSEATAKRYLGALVRDGALTAEGRNKARRYKLRV